MMWSTSDCSQARVRNILFWRKRCAPEEEVHTIILKLTMPAVYAPPQVEQVQVAVEFFRILADGRRSEDLKPCPRANLEMVSPHCFRPPIRYSKGREAIR